MSGFAASAITATPTSRRAQQGMGGVNVDLNYFTIILHSSVGTPGADSEVDAGL